MILSRLTVSPSPYLLSSSLRPSRFSHLTTTTQFRRMTNRPSPSTHATVPRPSASLIIVNPQNEVLLVQRNPRAGSFAGAYVSSCL